MNPSIAPFILPAAIAIIAATSFVARGRWLRFGLAIAGLLLVAEGLSRDHVPSVAMLGGLLSVINIFALAQPLLSCRKLGDEGALLRARHLPMLGAADVRRLLDEGSFTNARAGDVLMREGAVSQSLQFLVNGTAAVTVAEAIVGRIDAGDLMGEACLIPGGRASASVRIASDSARLWFIPGDRLHAFLGANPRIAEALSQASLAALQAKLDGANRDRLEN